MSGILEQVVDRLLKSDESQNFLSFIFGLNDDTYMGGAEKNGVSISSKIEDNSGRELAYFVAPRHSRHALLRAVEKCAGSVATIPLEDLPRTLTDDVSSTEHIVHLIRKFRLEEGI